MKKVNVNEKSVEREQRIQDFWNSNHIFEKSVANREGQK